MGAVYLFGEALSAAQILAIYQLGPGYQVGSEIKKQTGKKKILMIIMINSSALRSVLRVS